MSCKEEEKNYDPENSVSSSPIEESGKINCLRFGQLTNIFCSQFEKIELNSDIMLDTTGLEAILLAYLVIPRHFFLAIISPVQQFPYLDCPPAVKIRTIKM